MGTVINWLESWSRELSAGEAGFLVSVHLFVAFLQQVDSSCLGALVLDNNIPAASTTAITARLIQYFFCMVVVLGWDESTFQNVTANLKFLFFNIWGGWNNKAKGYTLIH